MLLHLLRLSFIQPVLRSKTLENVCLTHIYVFSLADRYVQKKEHVNQVFCGNVHQRN